MSKRIQELPGDNPEALDAGIIEHCVLGYAILAQ